MKLIKISLIILLFPSYLSAQQKTDSIYTDPETTTDTIPRLEIISEYRNGSIFLRWAPTDASAWYESAFSGYKLYRIEVDVNKGLPIMETIDSSLLMAWPKEKFSIYIDSTNENILIAAQCLYGEWEKNIDFTGTNAELLNRYSFAMFAADINWETAISLGQAYEDKTIENGKTYFYKVVPIDTSSRLIEGYLSITVKEIKRQQPIISNAVEGENSIVIQWDKEVHRDFFSGFYIEKSKDGKVFSRLNSRPFIGGESTEFPSNIYSFADSVDNYVKYYYRIIGITPFGKLSEASEPIIAMGRDKTPPPKPKGVSINCDVNTKTIKIDWDAVVSDDLVNYAIFRSNKSNGVFEMVSKPLLNAKTTHYSEKTPDLNKYFYYKIASVDTAGNYNRTLSYIAAFRDTTAPKSPVGLKGSIDSMGIVQLSWTPNTEDDIAGYHIYMSNSLSHMFVKISSHTLHSNSFMDSITLKTFTENIYYKITAIDFHGHFSDFSEIVKLKKPDIIPPFPPSIKSYKYDQKEGMVKIKWSPSKSSDLDHHEMYKSNKGKWKLVDYFDDKIYEFEDKNIESNKTYKYKIIAIDDDGLRSNSKAFVVIKTTDKSLPPTPEITICKFDKENNIKIEWSSSSDKKHQNYILYRSINNNAFTVLKRTNETSYLDKDISSTKKYSYAIKQSWKDGKKSKLSKAFKPL